MSVQQPEQLAAVHFTVVWVPQAESRTSPRLTVITRIMDVTLHAALSSAHHDFG